MPSAKNSSMRPVPTIADATAKTRSLVEDLQARLTLPAPRMKQDRPTPDMENGRLVPRTVDMTLVATSEEDDIQQFESEDDLERQLQAYFERNMPTVSTRTAVVDDLRRGVIDGVVEKVLAEWSRPQTAAPWTAGLKREVIEHLTERVLEQLQKPLTAK